MQRTANRCEAEISFNSDPTISIRCGNYTAHCPLECCETPEITDNYCQDCMETREVAGEPVKMCGACCMKFDHPAQRTPEFSAWLEAAALVMA